MLSVSKQAWLVPTRSTRVEYCVLSINTLERGILSLLSVMRFICVMAAPRSQEVGTIDLRGNTSRECPLPGPNAKSVLLSVCALDNEGIITGAGGTLRSPKQPN